MEEKQRINKYLAQKGIGSRREIDKYIEMEMITVNGELAVSGQKVDDNDKIEINGMLIEEQKEKKVYFMLNKPQGYISAVKDAREKTVVELIDTPERIYPVGRLDLNTEGLLILTNDGDCYNKLIHPRAEIWKTYIAKVWGRVTEEEVKELHAGDIGALAKLSQSQTTDSLSRWWRVETAGSFSFTAVPERGS